MPQKIRIVVFKDADHWVAQCLEHDICAQADTFEALAPRIQMAISLELESGGQSIEPAPAYFHTLWNNNRSRIHAELVFDSVAADVSIAA